MYPPAFVPGAFYTSPENQGFQDRSRSYQQEIYYESWLPFHNAGVCQHVGPCTLPPNRAAASSRFGARCSSQDSPNTNSEKEEYFCPRCGQEFLTPVAPEDWGVPYPRAFSTCIPSHLRRGEPLCVPRTSPQMTSNHVEPRRTQLDSNFGARAEASTSTPLQTWTSKEFASAGSASHHGGRCKPCAFVHQGKCKYDDKCEFCHLCLPGEKKRRQRERIKRVKAACRMRKSLFPFAQSQVQWISC